MAQYVYTMNRVGKIVPPKRVILKDISLSFFPGAKIGVLGLNGSGKSSLLRIMAGEDKEFDGEAVPMPNMRIGFLPQEPELDRHEVRARGGRRRAVRNSRRQIEARRDLRGVCRARCRFRPARGRPGEVRSDHRDGGRRHRSADGNRRRRAAPAAVGCDGREALRRREAAGGALPPAALQARHAAPGRADQSSRRRERRMAGAIPAALSRAP